MPTLNWIGKDKVINHHQEVPFRVLEHKYGYSDGIETTEETNSGNLIIHGDNLEALKSLLPKYQGKVNCIYIDPPYNTGNEKWVYNDNVNDVKIKKWLGKIVGQQGEDLSRHDKWLCMMYPRLVLLHKLLASNGIIFISIDDNEFVNLKLLCDEIFGANQNIGNLIWKKKQGGGNDSNNIVVEHEYILVYAKDISNAKLGLDKNYQLDNKLYPFKDEKGEYGLVTLDKASIQFSQSLVYEIVAPDGTVMLPRIVKGKQSCWRWSKDKVTRQYDDLVFKNGKVYTKYYKPSGVTQRSLLVDSVYGRTESGNDDIKDVFGTKPFDYPKPVALIKHLIEISTSCDSIILDSFAGSGTTAHAVLNINKKDGGNRKFILIEMENYADIITAERAKRVINGYGEGKKKVNGTGGTFDYYELGDRLFLEDGNINEDISENKIREYIFFSETNNATIAKRTDDNKYFLGEVFNTSYYFYYEKDKKTTLTHDTLRQIVKKKAEQYVIYADTCTLTEDEMNSLSVVYKKIPRDIKRF